MHVIHAVNGLGTGLILIPVNGNFILKVYHQESSESYSESILPLLELQSMLMQFSQSQQAF